MEFSFIGFIAGDGQTMDLSVVTQVGHEAVMVFHALACDPLLLQLFRAADLEQRGRRVGMPLTDGHQMPPMETGMRFEPGWGENIARGNRPPGAGVCDPRICRD